METLAPFPGIVPTRQALVADTAERLVAAAKRMTICGA